GYHIQDGNGQFSGIYVFDTDYTPELGDEITITAEVEEFYSLTELKNVSAYNVNSSANPLPDPIQLSTDEAGSEAYESVLIKVVEAECTNNNLGFGEFELNDGSGPIAVDDFFYLFTANQGSSYTVTGPLYYSFGTYKIVPRNAEDIEVADPLFFTQDPEEYNMTTTSMDITWSTNAPANSVVAYGLTPSFELGIVQNADQVTDHSITLENLNPSTPYYIGVGSQDLDGNSTTPKEWVVITTSEIEGSIEAYFNHTVNTSVSIEEDANYMPDFTAYFVEQIENATTTLDITMYHWEGDDMSIIDAINSAYENGVIVRVVTDIEIENLPLANLNSAIPVGFGTETGIMHNKFLIIDEGLPNVKVVTGSTNWTTGNLGWDFNNIIEITDQSMAVAYELEFNEMFGSNTATPDLENARFGSEKWDNTPHKFIVGGIPTELYFSPSDGATAQIRERILEAQNRLDFGVMVFTENSLGSAIITAENNGIDITGIMDYVEFNGSEYQPLLDADVNIMDYINEDGSQWPDGPVFHHKYLIVDHDASDENPILVTGSHNWSASAESINDENTLIISDINLANQFYQEYTQRRNEQLDLSITDNPLVQVSMYPNPTSQTLTIEGDINSEVEVFNLQGQLVLSEAMNNKVALDISTLNAGIYLVKVAGGVVGRVVIQ
ncbi:MAG: phospholipase D-like domain-containing protein, partial [Bacteroidota bacterium]